MWAEIYLMTIKMVVIFFHLISFWDSLIRSVFPETTPPI